MNATYWLQLALLLILGLLPIASAAPRKERPREPHEEAVDRGLAYLAKSQSKDGSWAAEFADNRPGGGHPALTSFAVMAFLSAGHVPGEGQYGPVVERGVRFVMNLQQPNGLFAKTDAGYTEVYSHGICTLMLAEAAGMTGANLADELKGRLER